MGIESIPIRIPDQWDSNWFRRFIVEVLAQLDTRNSLGDGVDITSEGNSVATLSTAGTIATHNADLSAHTPLIAAHNADVYANEPARRASTVASIASHVAQGNPHTQYARKGGDTFGGPMVFSDGATFFDNQGGGWKDIIGTYRNPSSAANAPTWTIIAGSSPFYAWKFGVGDIQTYYFHIPHDYVPGSNIFLHAHWFASGTDVNTVKWQFTYSFAKGFGQGAYNTTGTTATVEQASAGAYYHMVSEISTGILSSSLETDGVLMVVIERITNGVVDNGDNIFLLMHDVHYQSFGSGSTKNRRPDFHGDMPLEAGSGAFAGKAPSILIA